MPPQLTPENVRYLVVHCSASPVTVRVDRTVIDRWHRENGWLGIGYHFVIRRDGVVEVGRPLSQVGAHVEGFNSQSIGICLAGGVDAKLKPENNFTLDQFASLAKLLSELLAQHPKARICGHNELNPHKACPSFDVPKWWHETVAGPDFTNVQS